MSNRSDRHKGMMGNTVSGRGRLIGNAIEHEAALTPRYASSTAQFLDDDREPTEQMKLVTPDSIVEYVFNVVDSENDARYTAIAEQFHILVSNGHSPAVAGVPRRISLVDKGLVPKLAGEVAELSEVSPAVLCQRLGLPSEVYSFPIPSRLLPGEIGEVKVHFFGYGSLDRDCLAAYCS